MFAIFKKELRSYFITAIGYVYVGVFLAVAALLCCYSTLMARSYDTATYFTFLVYSFIILIPLLTMRLFSEEKKLRTEQLLLTAPVSLWGVVLGKFLAALTLFFGTLLASTINFFPLYSYARMESLDSSYNFFHVGPSTAEIISCLVGLSLMGAAFIAIGLFISSLTENQLSAAVSTVAVILVMLLLGIVNNYIDYYPLRAVISWVCVLDRFSNFTTGILDYSSILYYVSITGIFLLLTVRVYDKRRWS